MTSLLGKLLSINPGEERKSLLLYAFHLLFYVGLTWGDAARETLFLSAWSASDLAYAFVAYAVTGFIMGLLYAFIADRINNGLLLKIILGSMIVWLITVSVLLETSGHPGSLVYPYFYIAYNAFRDIATMHNIIYISDFYDTRAAKRALPLMLSAGIAGSTLAGFSAKALNQYIELKRVPVVWIICLIGCLALSLAIEKNAADSIERTERQRKKHQPRKGAPKSSGIQNLREGFKFVRESRLLRWLALATFSMVALLGILLYQTSQRFSVIYANDPDGLFAFYGYFNGISNIGGLIFQTLFLSRVINWFGVGTMNLLYPTTTFIAVVALGAFPSMATAIFGRLNYGALKQTFRNPLDAMLYNSVPIKSKARARGFVGGVIVPIGTLTSGLLVWGVKENVLSLSQAVALEIAIALTYLFSMLNVRREYTRAMTSLLAGEEFALFRQDASEALPPDPGAIIWLQEKLRNLPEDNAEDARAVFMCQILFELDQNKAAPIIKEMAESRGEIFRSEIIEFLSKENFNEPFFWRLCVNGMDDANLIVRQRSYKALLNLISRSAQRDEKIWGILGKIQSSIRELPLEEQSRLLILTLNYGSVEQQHAADALLDEWLLQENNAVSETDNMRLQAGLLVLIEIEKLRQRNQAHNASQSAQAERRAGRKSLAETLESVVKDPSPHVRKQAIPALIQQGKYAHWKSGHAATQSLLSLLDDQDETVRFAVVETLEEQLTAMPLKPLPWKVFNDPSLRVRRLFCNYYHDKLNWMELQTLRGCLETSQIKQAFYRSTSALYLLIRLNQPGFSSALVKIAEEIARDAYWLTLQALQIKELTQQKEFDRPGMYILLEKLKDGTLALLEELVWLIGAYSSEEEVRSVWRALSSEDQIERANAIEALDAALSPPIARHVRLLLDAPSSAEILGYAEERFGMRPFSANQVFCLAWTQLSVAAAELDMSERMRNFYADGWLGAATIYSLAEFYFSGAASLDLPLSTDALQSALNKTVAQESRVNVREIANLVIAKINAAQEDKIMPEAQSLTLIEKVIFLKEVPFFSNLPLQEIAILAGISEEVHFPANHRVFSQGDRTKTLYLIVRGRVSVQQQTKDRDNIIRLAVLGEKNYFAETSIFDDVPHQADIVTIDPTDILLVRQSTLFALLRRQPEIGLSLLRALSQKLRTTYAQAAKNERPKSQKLTSLFDKIEK